MGTKTLLTLEDFDRLQAPEGIWYELDEGALLTMVRPMPLHGAVQTRLAFYLQGYANRTKECPLVVFVEPEFQLSESTIRIPDLGVILGEDVKGLDLTKRLVGAPSLALEVISPEDTAENINRKVRQYLDAGAKAVWIVYPRDRQVHIWHPERPLEIRSDQESLEDQEVLPGFSVPVSELFP